MYFYQTLNQFGPSAVGFLVWEMSSPAVKREEQGEATPREKRGAGLKDPSLWDGDTTQELSVRVEIEGFCIFPWEFGLQETALLTW